MDSELPNRLIQLCESVCIKVRPFQPDRDEPIPTTVEKLKLFGIWNPRGLYLGHRFLSPSGLDYNVLGSCDVFKDAMVYQGARAGLQAAVDNVGLFKGFQEINTWVLSICDSAQIQGPLICGHRKAELQLRLIETTGHHENELYRDLAVSPDEIAAIMIPKHPIFNMNPMPPNVVQARMHFVIAEASPEAAPEGDPTLVASQGCHSIVVELNDRYGLKVNKAYISQHLEGVSIVMPYHSALNHDILLRTTMSRDVGRTRSSQFSQMFHCLDVMCQGLTMVPINDDPKLFELASLLVYNGAVTKLQSLIQAEPGNSWCLHDALTNGRDQPSLGQEGCTHHPKCKTVKVVDKDGVKALEFLM